MSETPNAALDPTKREERYQLFSSKLIDYSIEQDRSLLTIFSGTIALLTAYVNNAELAQLAVLLFVLAICFGLLGLGCCLMHMFISVQLCRLLAAMHGDPRRVPVLQHSTRTAEERFDRTSPYLQASFLSELVCLFMCALSAISAFVAQRYATIGLMGMVAVICLMTYAAYLISTEFRRASREGDAHAAQNCSAGHGPA